VRLLHTSDWHLGRTLVQTSLLPAQQTFLDWLVELAVREQVDALLVSGDVYDRAVPTPDAVRLLDGVLASLAAARIPVVLVSGNHDSAVRLGFGGALVEASGVHLRTSVDTVADPVVLRDEHGEVGVYGVPYLLPDAVTETLGCARTHEAVLGAVTERILADAATRGLGRTVVLSHAFVTGSVASLESDSERDVRVGGIGDAPAHVFDGVDYVALGHLHRPQEIALRGSSTRLRYSGSPMAFSFSEADDLKSVTLVELDADGVRDVRLVETPVDRRLREVRGRLDDLLERATTDLADLAECYVRVVLTDPSRPASPMERLRRHWPFTLTLAFEPDVAERDPGSDLARLAAATDPVEVCELFVEYVDNVAPSDVERALLRDVVETAREQAAS
jgi:exonuclease SbcD